MRRGHPGIGSWRNENPRHFRPRGGGPPPFRPGRNYALQEPSRFIQPGSRPPRGPYNNRPGLLNTPSPDLLEKNQYRHDSRPGNQYRSHDRNPHQGGRSIFPILNRMRHENKGQDKYKEKKYYDKTTNDKWRMNSMGDIDDRQPNHQFIQKPFNIHPISPWASADNRPYYDERNSQQPYRPEIAESNKIPVLEYSGHRPPSSDHYGGTPSGTLDNSNSFSRSVDDTVDIIRKRLQNRSDIQDTTEDQSVSSKDVDDRATNSMSNKYRNVQQTHTVKKRVQRQKQNIDANCDKMKNKIVHELFKMDKDKIHKLMDNPSSSSKFEYALNSFITESQNSLNRHLRSVAEKSLCTSEEFVHHDDNTIYEDTFMKQMQGVLDPQDSILLEDIKPLVLAELSKVLQLNEYDQPFQISEDQRNCEPTNNIEVIENYDDYSQNNYYDSIQSPQGIYENFITLNNDNNEDNYTNYEYNEPEQTQAKRLFERRPTKKTVEHDFEPRLSSESQRHSSESQRFSFESQRLSSESQKLSSELRKHSRSSVDANTPHKDNSFSIERRNSRTSDNKPKEEPLPLFDTSVDQLSDDEDPFAEFDKQYHVEVDHNFIETDISSPQQSTSNASNQFTIDKSPSNQSAINRKVRPTNIDPNNIKLEIDNQLHDIAKSPLKLPSAITTNVPTKTQEQNVLLTSTNTTDVIKREVATTTIKSSNDNNYQDSPLMVNIKQEHNAFSQNDLEVIEDSENINTPIKMLPSNPRKRSIDQKPSHRKEKRKKSDVSSSDTGKQILNKNIIINVNECTSIDTEKSKEAAKSIFNLYFSKNDTTKEVPKDTKRIESTDKTYSEKYVKRKEIQKKNGADSTKKKRQSSVSSNHSTVSPKENLNNNSQGNKPEPKTKLQSIDMFLEQPRKITQLYQASRNTNTTAKNADISKPKRPVITFNKKVTKRHISTQVCQKTVSKETQTFDVNNLTTRFCQTVRKKTTNKFIQTDPVQFVKEGPKATDTYERMKEIDLEIQVLLQEKFKLYNSIESSDPCPSTIQSLGMTVVDVAPDEEIKENDTSEVEVLSGDDIVEDFTNIPVEELEQIAFETIQDQNESKKPSRHQKILKESRASSSSPTTRRNSKKGTPNTPNISLIEQILTDDRPLEDIISLDDLETTPLKNKKQKKVPKKKAVKKSKKVKPSNSMTDYNLKECYVVLTRDDISEYYRQKKDDVFVKTENITVSVDNGEIIVMEPNILIEEVVSNDLQFDMLDVSEDIVIGDNCEVKSSSDKDVERTEVAIAEEIILDNSQSTEPVHADLNHGENICKMYDYSTDENLRRDAVVVTGHADAVLAIECIENNFIAACLDGNVYHFGADGQLITTLKGSNLAVTCLTIVKEKYGTTVYTGSLDSRIRYYDLETGLEKGPECNVLSPIQTMDRAWDTIFVGTRTGFVLQFECKNNMLIPVSTVKFSEQSILALRAMKEGPRKVLLVAARSEDVTIKDAQTGLLLRSLQGPKMTVYTLLYEDGKIYCGTSSHQIHVFDYASGSHVGAHEGGKGAVCLRAAGGLLFAGCYDGCVYIYREGEPKPLAQLRGPGLMLLSLAVVDTRIIAGYKDRSLYIWKIPSSVQQEMIL